MSARPDPRTIARRRATALALLGAVIVVVLVVLLTGSGSGGRTARTASGAHPSSRTTRSASSSAPEPNAGPPGAGVRYGVGSLQLSFTEPATPGTATAQEGGRPVRILPTLVLFPVSMHPQALTSGTRAGSGPTSGPFPLIAFSQGFDEPVSGYLAMLDRWVRAGYVVAAPTYPLTAPSAAGVRESDIVHHPADLRFVLNALSAASRAGTGPLAGLIDSRDIALAGQSDGGDVTLAAAANSCCEIPGVRAAIILSGAESHLFGGRYDAGGSPPLLVTQGDADTINPPGCSAALYDQAPAPKVYLDLLGAGHLPPYSVPGPDLSAVDAWVLAFLDAHLRDTPGPLGRLLAAGGRPGVARATDAPTLSGAATACSTF